MISGFWDLLLMVFIDQLMALLAINGKLFASAARAKSILPGVDSLGSDTDFMIYLSILRA